MEGGGGRAGMEGRGVVGLGWRGVVVGLGWREGGG